jgi:tetratricopeptide (TPR) repeat protein
MRISTQGNPIERLYSLAQEQNDAGFMLGACRALSCTLYWSGNCEAARQYARRGVQIGRSEGVQSYAEDLHSPVVGCLCYEAFAALYLGEIAHCRANLEEAISLAKESKDMNDLAFALAWTAGLGHAERNPAEVERHASDLIELSTRHNFVYWLALGAIWRGWARSASGNTTEGIPWIEQGIRDYRATGSMLGVPSHLSRKAEALYLADRTSEALEAINEAEALAERFEQSVSSAELHRLRAVFLAATGAKEFQIEASFGEAIRIAKEQKSVSLQKRAEATYAEYRRQKAIGPGFRLPL